MSSYLNEKQSPRQCLLSFLLYYSVLSKYVCLAKSCKQWRLNVQMMMVEAVIPLGATLLLPPQLPNNSCVFTLEAQLESRSRSFSTTANPYFCK